jgi:glycosyltransferase involved in cell wall biosynthesis
VSSPGFGRSLVARGIPEEKIDLVHNWCDEKALVLPEPDDDLAKELGLAGRFNIVFAGAMGVVQALDVVVEAARILVDRAPDVLFTLVGGGVDVQRLKKASEVLPNIQFLPNRPASEMGGIYRNADAVLVHLKHHPLCELWIPSKIQAYMYVGKPILCGVKGDVADLVCEAKAGIPFAPENPVSLAEAVLALRRMGRAELQRMGENGRTYYRQHLAFQECVRKLELVFEKAIGSTCGKRIAGNALHPPAPFPHEPQRCPSRLEAAPEELAKR